MVTPEIVFVVPVEKAKTLTAWSPLIVSRFVPGPVMVVLSVIGGKGEASVIVPVTMKEMVSSPLAPLASRMACLNDPGPESPVAVTSIIAPWVLPSASIKTAVSKTLSFILVELPFHVVLIEPEAGAELKPLVARMISGTATSGALPENVNSAVKSSYLLSFLESVPEVAARLREPESKERKFEDVVRSAEQAAVLVLVY